MRTGNGPSRQGLREPHDADSARHGSVQRSEDRRKLRSITARRHASHASSLLELPRAVGYAMLEQVERGFGSGAFHAIAE